MAGYGDYIRKAREAAGLTPEQLADRMDRTKGSVYRIEAEDQYPDVEKINVLCSVLEISAEELLRRMDVNLNPPAAARLPKRLVTSLLRLGPADLRTIERTARALAALPPEEGEPAP